MSPPRVPVSEVRRIARLAGLALAPAEVDRLAADLGRVASYFDRLRSLPVPPAVVDPDAGAGAPLRDDRVRSGLERETLLSLAPETEAGHLLVPGVLDG